MKLYACEKCSDMNFSLLIKEQNLWRNDSTDKKQVIFCVNSFFSGHRKQWEYPTKICIDNTPSI